MGTKERPGAYNCYGAAAPNEHTFTLRSTDPYASYLVLLWAAARDHSVAEMQSAFQALATTVVNDKRDNRPDKTEEARRCAAAMIAWPACAQGDHARELTGNERERARGLVRGRCMYCYVDMTVDSSD